MLDGVPHTIGQSAIFLFADWLSIDVTYCIQEYNYYTVQPIWLENSKFSLDRPCSDHCFKERQLSSYEYFEQLPSLLLTNKKKRKLLTNKLIQEKNPAGAF